CSALSRNAVHLAASSAGLGADDLELGRAWTSRSGGASSKPGSHVRIGGVQLPITKATTAASSKAGASSQAQQRRTGALLVSDSEFEALVVIDLSFHGRASYSR